MWELESGDPDFSSNSAIKRGSVISDESLLNFKLQFPYLQMEFKSFFSALLNYDTKFSFPGFRRDMT